LTPNADVDGGDIVRQAQSFLMSNVAPQDQKLNREGWAALERAVRKMLRSHHRLNVITGVWFDAHPRYIGKRRQQKVAVPSHWYKIILDPDNMKAMSFWLPNKPIGKRQWYRYRTSIDTIEGMTGIDFFSQLPDEVEHRLEKDSAGKY